jgi:hypothetical protein
LQWSDASLVAHSWFIAPGAGGNCDWADLTTAETPGYDFAFRHHRAAVGVNYDFPDDDKTAG